jgi:thiamine transporter
VQSQRIRLLVEIALTIALSVAVKAIAIRLPWNIAGGQISFEMLPILILAIRRGLWPGVVAGAAFGVIDVILEPYVVHPAQFVLDYPLAFALLGLAGLGSTAWKRAQATGASWTNALVWGLMTLGAGGRFLSHFASGVIFFSANAADAHQNVYLYSALYNASYIVPSLILSATAGVVLLPLLERVAPVLSQSPDSSHGSDGLHGGEAIA